MKKIFGILMFFAVFGMLIGSVAAADLVEHDFDGHFTLKVPGHYWMGTNSKGDSYDNGEGVKISHYTVAQIKERGNENFEDYINELVEKGLEPMGNDGNISIYKNNDKYTVFVQSEEEIYAITDPDLDEAKEIARSADFGTDTQTTSNNESSTPVSNDDLEKVTVGDVLAVNAPESSSFDNGSIYDGFWTVFHSSEKNVHIYYASGNVSGVTIDDASFKDYVNNFTNANNGKLSQDGNISIVEGIQLIDGDHEVFVHFNNQIVGIISDDLGLSKEMAKSVEFLK